MQNRKNKPHFFKHFVQFPINQIIFSQENLYNGSLESMKKELTSADAHISGLGNSQIGVHFYNHDIPKMKIEWIKIIAKYANSAKRLVWDIDELTL